MERASAPAPHPALLPPGTVVGRWLVLGWAGQGIHGAVYRAVPVDQELAAPVALKLAMLPRDPRFAREVELLSRMRHPSIPRLLDSGEWQHPSGTLHPYFVTEWVDGAPLYDQARQHPPSSPQVLRWLSQLARALQALHAHGAVHRDLKGDNVLVRRSDSRAILTDFGSGNYPGAVTLTPPALCLGTPAYLSPEAGLFELHSLRDRSARYGAKATDDLYALGVTACRLVTGKYPDFADPTQDENGTWHLEAVLPPASLLDVEPPLRTLVLRMLSVRPEQRGTAAELAEALEQAAAEALASQRQEPTAPLEVQEQAPEKSPPAHDSSARVSPRSPPRRWRSWLATAAAGLVLAPWAWWATHGPPVHKPSLLTNESEAADQADGGTAGLGETAASTAPVEAATALSFQEVPAEAPPPEPQPGQTRPDAKGRCPHKRQVALNGGCWVALEPEKCEALKLSLYKGACYVPVIPPGLPSTSTPATQP
jgi:serine/threonine protein kinase